MWGTPRLFEGAQDAAALRMTAFACPRQGAPLHSFHRKCGLFGHSARFFRLRLRMTLRTDTGASPQAPESDDGPELPLPQVRALSAALEVGQAFFEESTDALGAIGGGLEDYREVGLVAQALVEGHFEAAMDGLLGVAQGYGTSF